MPDPGSIEVGKAHIEITADNSSVDGKVTETQAKTEQLGNTADATAAQIQSSMDAASASTERVGMAADTSSDALGAMGSAAAKVQGVVSKIAIPLAVAGTLSQIIRLLRRSSDEAERLAKTMDQFGDATESSLEKEVIALRNTDDLLRRKLEINREVIESQKAVTDEIERQFKAQEKLTANEDFGISVAVDTYARLLGFRTNLNKKTKEAVADADRENKILKTRLALIDEEIKRREDIAAAAKALADEEAERNKAIAAEQAKQFENQTKLLEAQARGQEAFIREQIAQLAEEYAEQIDRADDESQKKALERRLSAMRRLLQQQLGDIQIANEAQIAAEKKADEERRRREHENHKRRLRDIEERARKEREALDDLIRRQQEGFDRINQELVVGLKGIATAVQQARSRSSAGPIELGGGA